MEIVLVRHALPVARVVDAGAADPPLAPEGVHQANLLAAYLGTESIDAVYASPLARAVQTAEPLASALGREVVIDAGLAEWDRTSPEYIPVEVMKATDHPQWQAMVRGEWMASDESSAAFHARVVDTIERLIGCHPGQRIALVCHGGVVNAYLGQVIGRADQSPFFYPNYTSIHRVVAARSGERSIISVNETAHLRAAGVLSSLHEMGGAGTNAPESP